MVFNRNHLQYCDTCAEQSIESKNNTDYQTYNYHCFVCETVFYVDNLNRSILFIRYANDSDNKKACSLYFILASRRIALWWSDTPMCCVHEFPGCTCKNGCVSRHFALMRSWSLLYQWLWAFLLKTLWEVVQYTAVARETIHRLDSFEINSTSFLAGHYNFDLSGK